MGPGVLSTTRMLAGLAGVDRSMKAVVREATELVQFDVVALRESTLVLAVSLAAQKVDDA